MFKERLKNLRMGKDVSQGELGKMLGVGSTTITAYEKGIIEYPPLDKMMKLADYFGVSIDYLAGRTDARNTLQLGNVCDVSDDLKYALDDITNGNALVYYRKKLLTPAEKDLLITIISNTMTLIDTILRKWKR